MSPYARLEDIDGPHEPHGRHQPEVGGDVHEQSDEGRVDDDQRHATGREEVHQDAVDRVAADARQQPADGCRRGIERRAVRQSDQRARREVRRDEPTGVAGTITVRTRRTNRHRAAMSGAADSFGNRMVPTTMGSISSMSASPTAIA